ncbi:ferric reduction oxidase 2-like [Cynara cardunculus var. scolymus]|uniref:ferric reduction oxidase 2-like n=1 Tax=Cynara cardunculus var. scolymus TaxID=59895 RepID=UPI000D62C777|nr:ferric reduction oxidase 2-like [Cynara cardunculus var. scolymus]
MNDPNEIMGMWIVGYDSISNKGGGNGDFLGVHEHMGDDAYKHILATLVAPYPFRHSFNLFRPTTRREYSNLHNPSRPYCNFGMYIPSPGKQVCPPSKQSKSLFFQSHTFHGDKRSTHWGKAYIHAMFATITTQSASRMGEKVWEVKLDSVGLMLGLAGNICLALLFFPVTRGSSVLRLIGLTSECSIKYHIWLGHTTMVFFTAHDHLCLIQMVKWEKIGISNVAGEVALLTGIAIWSTTIPRIRRSIFELFFYTHHLYILFVVFFILHAGFSYCWITLPGFYLFLIDRLLRFLQSQQKVRLVSARVLPCQAVELNFAKTPGLHYNSMSSIFINIPSISKLQWHPFSITSSSNLDLEKLSVVVKSEGTWSQKLYEELSLPSPIDHLQVSVEGPYGPASTNFHQYDNLVMFSGGSGITPFISIIRELLYIANESSNSPQVLLIPAFKKSADLAMLDLLLPLSGTSHDLSRLQLQIQAYITQERGHTTEEQQFYRTIWFKPSALDAPISAILGRNCWLWLGVIIVCSSVIFLALIALLTQFYIYPIDHDTNMIYSYSVRSAFNMVLISMSIATTATIAFLWNKKRNSTEMRQIQMTDAPTPTTSPGMSSWSYNTDRELESLPSKTFIGSTKVNYGERPDFKKILMETEGSSIGVLVSGPKKMRQDVAAICSSGLSKSFQFESISFSW